MQDELVNFYRYLRGGRWATTPWLPDSHPWLWDSHPGCQTATPLAAGRPPDAGSNEII